MQRDYPLTRRSKGGRTKSWTRGRKSSSDDNEDRIEKRKKQKRDYATRRRAQVKDLLQSLDERGKELRRRIRQERRTIQHMRQWSTYAEAFLSLCHQINPSCPLSSPESRLRRQESLGGLRATPVQAPARDRAMSWSVSSDGSEASSPDAATKVPPGAATCLTQEADSTGAEHSDSEYNHAGVRTPVEPGQEDDLHPRSTPSLTPPVTFDTELHRTDTVGADSVVMLLQPWSSATSFQPLCHHIYDPDNVVELTDEDIVRDHYRLVDADHQLVYDLDSQSSRCVDRQVDCQTAVNEGILLTQVVPEDVQIEDVNLPPHWMWPSDSGDKHSEDSGGFDPNLSTPLQAIGCM